MGGPRVGIIGAGGVGVATASAIIMRGLAGRVTIYSRKPESARGLALDFLHARPLLPSIEIRGLGLDADRGRGHPRPRRGPPHRRRARAGSTSSSRTSTVMDDMATAVEAAEMPRIALVVTNPLDVLTEYLSRRWADRPVAVMGSGTSLDTLRLTQRIAQECQVHAAQRPRLGGRRARRLVGVPARQRDGRHVAAARVRGAARCGPHPGAARTRSRSTSAARRTRCGT